MYRDPEQNKIDAVNEAVEKMQKYLADDPHELYEILYDIWDEAVSATEHRLDERQEKARP